MKEQGKEKQEDRVKLDMSIQETLDLIGILDIEAKDIGNTVRLYSNYPNLVKSMDERLYRVQSLSLRVKGALKCS